MPEQRAARVAGSLRARIPREYESASFEHSNVSGLPRQAVQDVRRYVDALPQKLADGDGLWFSGGTGTGKTWLAMLVAKRAIEGGHGVAIYNVPRLLSEIRRTYDGEGVSTLDLLDQLTSVPLLVLDDIGVERSNPWVLEQLYTVINERWQERRSIILTTNLDRQELNDHIGERAVSRLVGMCDVVPLGVGGDAGDHRIRHGDTSPAWLAEAVRDLPGAPRPDDRRGDPAAPDLARGAWGPPPPYPGPAPYADAPPYAGDGTPRAGDGTPRADDRASSSGDGTPRADDRASSSGDGTSRADVPSPPDLRPEHTTQADGGPDGRGPLPPRPDLAPPPASPPPAARPFGADPADLRRPDRRVHDERDHRRRP
jgi:DNA replication protein DnaC